MPLFSADRPSRFAALFFAAIDAFSIYAAAFRDI